ncbi:MAG TPA: response regulator, partial [Mucilaginibacter sp.]
MAAKILVIDNDAETLEVIRLVLDFEGFDVIATMESDDVPGLVRIHQPDLLLIDYLLNGIDGSEICAVLKNAFETASLPIVIMSAYPKGIQSKAAQNADAFIA